MTTILDLNPFMKLFPARDEEPKSGQYYYNVNPIQDDDVALWKFSISGPGNNGPTIVRFLVDADDPVIQEWGINSVINITYQMFLERWPMVDLVNRTIT